MATRLMDLEVARELGRAPEERRRAVSATLSQLARVLLRLPSPALARLERELRAALPAETSPETASDTALDELDVRNALRVFAHWRRVEERSMPGSRLQAQLGVSRQRLQQLRAEKRLLALRVPMRRELYYPVWQFADDGSPLEGMPRLLATAAEARLAPLELDALMTSESAGGGVAPATLLRLGREDEVLPIVRAALAHGA